MDDFLGACCSPRARRSRADTELCEALLAKASKANLELRYHFRGVW